MGSQADDVMDGGRGVWSSGHVELNECGSLAPWEEDEGVGILGGD